MGCSYALKLLFLLEKPCEISGVLPANVFRIMQNLTPKNMESCCSGSLDFKILGECPRSHKKIHAISISCATQFNSIIRIKGQMIQLWVFKKRIYNKHLNGQSQLLISVSILIPTGRRFKLKSLIVTSRNQFLTSQYINVWNLFISNSLRKIIKYLIQIQLIVRHVIM